MHHLKDIQGSGQILQLLKHLRVQSPFQKMWLIALHWAQLQSGFHVPLLQDPKVPAPHLESLYISSLREFLASINGSKVTEHSYTIPMQRTHDRAIMDLVIASNLFTSTECKIINYCRMFLRVHSIADLTLAGGKHIDPSFLALNPSLLSSASTLVEPLQDRHSRYGNGKIGFGAIQLQEDYTNHWENGWFRVQSSGGVGPFTLIQIPTHCGVELEKDSVFILVSKEVTT
jgi:hypothetical protein